MRTQCNNFRRLRDAIDAGGKLAAASLISAEHQIVLSDLVRGSSIHPSTSPLASRSVLIAAQDPLLAAQALIEVDGLARRIVLCPPDLALEHLPYVIRHAEVDAVVSDGNFLASAQLCDIPHLTVSTSLNPRTPTNEEYLPTEWVLLTSGTTGRPKMVLHTLASLTGAIRASDLPADVVWGTFYDIRRYGGLQIYLRAVLTHSSLLLTSPQEPLADFLQRAGNAGVTHISGTPSHWRRALMSDAADRIAPKYIRLSGEIADQAILNSLASNYAGAAISHAFATTEAGVAFDVRDGLAGFPANALTLTPEVEMNARDGTLRIRSNRTAQRYLGENPPVLKDEVGYVDTGDVLELRDGRYHFQGRRDGVINVGGLKVHPEEVEAVLNRHPQVRLSLVKTKKSPITGALVVADVILKDASTAEGEHSRNLQQTIKQFCRESLAAHKVPTTIRFVPSLAISDNGKLVRSHA